MGWTFNPVIKVTQNKSSIECQMRREKIFHANVLNVKEDTSNHQSIIISAFEFNFFKFVGCWKFFTKVTVFSTISYCDINVIFMMDILQNWLLGFSDSAFLFKYW